MAGRQAKVLTAAQIKTTLLAVQGGRYPLRDRVMLLLSVKAGLRAKEVASCSWAMVMTAEGDLADALHLENKAAKMGSGRVIPLNTELRDALTELMATRRPKPSDPIVYSERGRSMSASTVATWFWSLYQRLGFIGCSSHSGRRTFITNAARRISTVGGSLRDVQELAGHSSLSVTQRYIDGDEAAKRKVVNLL